jgi:hypothetical protein
VTARTDSDIRSNPCPQRNEIPRVLKRGLGSSSLDPIIFLITIGLYDSTNDLRIINDHHCDGSLERIPTLRRNAITIFAIVGPETH